LHFATPGPSRRFHYRLRVALLALYLVHTYRFISLCSLFPDCCCCSCSHRLADLYLTLWFGFADCRLSILLGLVHLRCSFASAGFATLNICRPSLRLLTFFTLFAFFFFHVLYTYSSSCSPLGRTLFYLFSSSVLAGAPSRAVENWPGGQGLWSLVLPQGCWVFFFCFVFLFLVLLVCVLLKNGIRVCKRLKEREEDLFPGFGCIGLGLVQGVRWLIQVTKVAITNKRRMWNLGGFGGFGFGKAVSQSVCILRCCSFLGCWLAECPARRYLDWLSGYLFVFLLSSERGRMAICSTLG
jgi:hypothetical protein